jgi:hypothetical protein
VSGHRWQKADPVAYYGLWRCTSCRMEVRSVQQPLEEPDGVMVTPIWGGYVTVRGMSPTCMVEVARAVMES